MRYEVGGGRRYLKGLSRDRPFEWMVGLETPPVAAGPGGDRDITFGRFQVHLLSVPAPSM